MRFKEYFYHLVLEANADKRIEFLYNNYKKKLHDWLMMLGGNNGYILKILQRALSPYIESPDEDILKSIYFKKPNDLAESLVSGLSKDIVNFIVHVVDPENGIYSEWILRKLLNGLNESTDKDKNLRFDPDFSDVESLKRWFVEDYYKVTEDLKKYHKYKKLIKKHPEVADQTDINKVYTFDDLAGILEYILDDISDAESGELLKAAEKDSEKVYNSENYMIVVPKTQEASCAYGRRTRWCTAATGSNNYFHRYNRDGPLYIVIDKKSQEKYQFHFQSEQYMDAEDDRLDLKDFFETHQELKNPLIDLAIKNNNINFVLNVDIDLALEKMESFDEPTQEKCVRENSLCAFRLGLKKPEFVNKTQPLFIFENNSVSIRTNINNFSDLAEQFVASSRHGNETETAKQVLGDGLDPYYDAYGASYDSDYWDWLDTKSQMMMKKYVWAAYNVEISSISEAEDLVNEHDDEYIKDLLTRCFDDAGQAAYESAYHKVAMDAIFDALGKTFERRNNTIVFTEFSYKQIQEIFDNFIEHFSEDAIPVSLPHDFLSQLETYLRETDQLTIPDFDRASNNSYPTRKEQGDVFNERFRNDLEIPESQQPELDLSSFKNYFKWTVIK
jgi:hypothetical protein